MKLSNESSLRLLLIAACFNMLVISCAPFQESPYSDTLLSKEKNLNLVALDRMKNIDADGKIRIAVLADAHQNYAALDSAINQINDTTGIDFVVNLGDFSNSGYNLEYDQYIDSYTSLRAVALTVIGNHDSIGAGPDLYRQAFSQVNYWFESSNLRYIFFDSANLEDPADFDPQWLKDTVTASSKPVIIFTHCSLQDPDRFTGATAQIFSDVLNDPKVQLVLNGHNHVYSLTYAGTTPLLQAGRVEGFAWLLLEIQGHQLKIQRMDDGSTTELTLKN